MEYIVKYFIQDPSFRHGKIYVDKVVIGVAGSTFEDIRKMIALKKGIVIQDIIVRNIEMI